MSFYDRISKYYDYIFPVSESQVKFISESAGSAPKRILDVACGSGGYSIELAKEGYSLTGVDLERRMVKMAEEKARIEGVSLDILQCDMLELEKTLHSKFDCIFCIGNSIVHLPGTREISGVLKQMHTLLIDNGALVLQTINYDRIINLRLSGLPTIKNDEIGLEFIRRYEYLEEKGVINFVTTLVTHENGKREEVKGSVELFPMLMEDMKKMLVDAGFSRIQFYGDFGYSPFDENSYMLVVKATK